MENDIGSGTLGIEIEADPLRVRLVLKDNGFVTCPDPPSRFGVDWEPFIAPRSVGVFSDEALDVLARDVSDVEPNEWLSSRKDQIIVLSNKV